MMNAEGGNGGRRTAEELKAEIWVLWVYLPILVFVWKQSFP